ncbi:MAG: hypothetical protein U5R30_20575 [Deltaproteobacteria bacterium]|nr:hypothetical protein [Deltaproteobacteria bacterium]
MSDNMLFDLGLRKKRGRESALDSQFKNDEARRATSRKETAQKRKDPEFRKSRGSRIGSDEDISRPVISL